MTDSLIRDGRLDHDAAAAEIERFLRLLLRETRLELAFEIRAAEPAGDDVEQPDLLVVFRGRDEELLLERHAELLLALEYLALRWLRLDPHFHDRICFECADYRALRLEELKLSARVAAQRVRETGQAFRFNPMPPRERRVIHLVLKDTPGVRTSSEGTGERRQVVVFPDKSR
jgi:spoIIIJ-associated protein